MKKAVSWLERVVGTSEAEGLQHLVINLLVFVGLGSGVVFFVTDALLALDPLHFLYDTGMVAMFGTLYWQSRFRKRYRLVAHLGTIAALGFFTANFFINAGIVGPTLMVIVMMLGFTAIVHPPRVGLAYFAVGCVLSAGCLLAQAFSSFA